MDRRELLKVLTAIPALRRVEVADVKTNDVLVVSVDRPITIDHANQIKHSLQEVWPNQKIVLLQEGVSLRIVKAKDA